MTLWELGLAAALYLAVMVRYAINENYGMALTFGAYALANVGFIWAAK